MEEVLSGPSQEVGISRSGDRPGFLNFLSSPQSKVEKVKTLNQSISTSFLRRKDLDSLIGFRSFATDFLLLGRLFLKPIYRRVNSNSSPLQR